MKWTYFIKQKLKAAFALAIVFLLVLATNMLNKRHFEELHESITSVYKDRLLVENYIYKISDELNAKRMALYDSSFHEEKEIDNINSRIRLNIEAFQKTTLTDEEAKVLTDLVDEIKVLERMEGEYFKVEEAGGLASMLKQHKKLDQQLSRLSEIQLEEGKKLLSNSEDILTVSNLSSRFELIVLIIIGLIIQAIIFSSKSLKTRFEQKPNLN